MKAFGGAGLLVDVVNNTGLVGNQALYLGGKLHVSPAVEGCLNDPDTSTETLKGLLIAIMPSERPWYRPTSQDHESQGYLNGSY